MGKAFLTLLIFYTAVIVPIAALAEARECKWTKSTSVNTLSMTRVKSVSSRIHCGVACLQSKDCISFCFDDINRICYIQDLQSSKPLSVTVSKCFTKKLDTVCPTVVGYSLIGSLCLKLMRFPESYWDASEECRQDHGHLVVMKTTADQEAISLLYKKEKLTQEAMSSLHDLVWPDGSKLSTTSSMWGYSEPWLQPSFKCACFGIRIRKSKESLPKAELHMCDCQSPRPFICQVDM